MHKPYTHILKEKEHIADRILFVCGLFLVIPVVVSLSRYEIIGLQPIMFIQLIMSLSCWYVYLSRKHISYSLRLSGLTIILFIAGIAGVVQFAFIGNGMAWMILGPALGTLFFSVRVGVLMTAIGAAAIACIGYFFSANQLNLTFDLYQFTTDTKVWADLLFSYSFIVILLVITISKINKGLISALKTAALHHLEIEKLVNEQTKQLKQVNKRLLIASREDFLTGLLNRGAFIDVLKNEIDSAKQNCTPLSMLFIDIDYFKKINDTYGHSVADHVLIFIAKELALSVKKTDRVGRLGGEEFAIFLPNTDLDDAYLIAERIRKNIQETCVEGDKHNISVTISIGVSTLKHNEDVSAFINRADKAMYLAKNTGRNRVKISTS